MIDILRQRRSIRKYTDQPIEQKKVDTLKEAALRSPSSRNFNPWEFIFVDNKDTITKLADCKQHGSAFMAGATLAIVVLGDENKSDVWVEDCSIASILLQLTAQSLGLGSCWVQVRNRQSPEDLSSEKFIHHLLHIPENMRVESVIALGYPAEQRDAKPIEELQYEKIKMNKY